MSYLTLKYAHVALVAISLGGFALRGLLMIRGSASLEARWVRVAPHLVDTALMATGIGLAIQSKASPVEQPWLAAKLLALVGYIVLGSVALRRGRTARVRRIAFAAALAVAAYIVAAALSRSAVPF